MWKELIQLLEPRCEFNNPASLADIAAAESRLHTSLPAELKALLQESDGVWGEYGLGLVWPWSE